METINVISNNNSLSLIAIRYNNGLIKLMGTYQNKYKIDTVFTKQNDGILCIKFDPLDEFVNRWFLCMLLDQNTNFKSNDS